MGELQYQVCTEEICWPKGKLKLIRTSHDPIPTEVN